MQDEFEGGPMFQPTTRVETIQFSHVGIISLPGNAFKGQNDTDSTYCDMDEGWIKAEADGIVFLCPLQLPEGMKITEIMVWGNAGATAETYKLLRIGTNNGSAITMATANIGTEDISITHGRIENGHYHYVLATTSLDTNDEISGVRIKYEA